jgi:hypothetical protein
LECLRRIYRRWSARDIYVQLKGGRSWFRAFATGALILGADAALGFWVYANACHHATRGAFPVAADSPITILLFLWWWWLGLEPRTRDAPFDILTIQPSKQSQGRPESRAGTLKKRVFWTSATIIIWMVLELRATSAAQLALSAPSTQSLIRYGVAALEFFLFLFLWVSIFPIIRSSTAGNNRASYLSKGRTGARAMFLVATWVIAFLVRVAVALYILMVVRSFVPISMLLRVPPDSGFSEQHSDNSHEYSCDLYIPGLRRGRPMNRGLKRK